MGSGITVIRGGITSAKGFHANGVSCGIKRSKRPDLGLLYSEVPAVASCAFTANRFAASPIIVSRRHLAAGPTKAVIVNSGNANCANGREGDRDAYVMTAVTAAALGVRPGSVLVASTGIIGRKLPVRIIEQAVPSLVRGLGVRKGGLFARAIMTTDTVVKESCVRFSIGASRVTIGGTCKGAGMICPDLKHATMLCFVTTDVAISKSMLTKAVAKALDVSFNLISVDGDMSTNDTVMVLANGMAHNARITKENAAYRVFSQGLSRVMADLAQKIVRDGEGATKFVEVTVKGARRYEDARAVARSIANSTLLKAALYGEDPNWGRIYSAAGSSGVSFRPEKFTLSIGDVKVVSKGAGVGGLDVAGLRRLFKKGTIRITVDLGQGGVQVTAWTCDLSKEYIDINAAYST